ncbi:DVU0298 family protein [Desulfonatronovibrio hydrogenovorans]|uniref:DVU0298 family protein n=1 Tax=Desulfonatronovibrio hydrogenovorans TaxID=53245 RepID=UPI00069116C9|nr:DVU0298 family protein [Desulfonatronovibrio hydrogenovorans]
MKKLKSEILAILAREDITQGLTRLDRFNPRSVLSPVFSALLNPDRQTRWHAVTAMGHVVARIADQDMEQARMVMRRLMWSLNDESGGIGWGAAQCMGEIMAVQQDLAQEYHPILFSYLVERSDGADNYLELLSLRRGAFWGLARFAQGMPGLAAKGLGNALTALEKHDDLFTLVCLCLFFDLTGNPSGLLQEKLRSVQAESLTFYWDRKLLKTRAEVICTLPGS